MAGQERTTRQREVIRRVFLEARRPLSVQEAHGLCLPDLPRLGIATVYRAVNLLVGTGELHALEIPGIGTCYESSALGEHHGHFVCDRCHRVFELPGGEESAPPTLPPGFRVHHVEVLVQGACADCGLAQAGD